MAAIAFNTQRATGHIETMLVAARRMLDLFVSSRLRLAAAEVRARQARREGGSPEVLPNDEAADPGLQFQPLDSAIVSAAIPSFFIGRNKDGFWVARDALGRTGGVFLLARSALAFARRNSPPTGCATIFPQQRFELDLPNSGNPLVPRLGSLMRVAKRGWRRTVGPSGKPATAAKRQDDRFRT